MKVFYTALIAFLFTISFSNAQLADFLSKDGLEKAKSKAIEDGIAAPSLIAIAAANVSPTGLPITLKLDIETGKANAWIYVFQSPTDKTVKKMYAVTLISILGNQTYTAIPLSADLISQYLSVVPSEDISSVNWMNSSDIYKYLSQNAEYKAFVAQKSVKNPLYMALAKTAMIPNQPEATMWGLSFSETSATEKFVCTVNAVSGETKCAYINGSSNVEIKDNSTLAYPNPANNAITLSLPSEFLNSNISLNIYDESANLRISNFNLNLSETVISLPIETLSSGIYTIVISNGSNKITSKFAVNK
jgi:hypothetical protein